MKARINAVILLSAVILSALITSCAPPAPEPTIYGGWRDDSISYNERMEYFFYEDESFEWIAYSSGAPDMGSTGTFVLTETQISLDDVNDAWDAVMDYDIDGDTLTLTSTTGGGSTTFTRI